LNDDTNRQQAFDALKRAMDSYHPLTNETWEALRAICKFVSVNKYHHLYPAGQIPASFAFVFSGLFRVFITDGSGSEYTKIFFEEGQFPGSMSALLTGTPSRFTIEALEPSQVIEIHFKAYRQLLMDSDDLKLFQIHYLEKNWLLAKEPREVELVQEDATQRYQRFVSHYPSLVNRVPQYHIASHLGITATQLSRIRKKLQNQPM
jgi:CRP-like cAMP-binding protein